MRLSIPINSYDKKNIIMVSKTNNNIMNGYFYRIYYSTSMVTLNSFFCNFKLENIRLEKYYTKIKCQINYNHNHAIINKIRMIEKSILENLDILTIEKKNKKLRISDQLDQDFIKIVNEYNININSTTCNILLKISGIWEDEESYGITFKFFLI